MIFSALPVKAGLNSSLQPVAFAVIIRLWKGEKYMEFLLNTEPERCRMEVYNEYLKKIPQLLQQLQTVETMYEKAMMEEQMLASKDPADHSVNLYGQRLKSTRAQCEARSADIRQQLKLIFALKKQIEEESSALKALAE
jgi:hypothetical protein